MRKEIRAVFLALLIFTGAIQLSSCRKIAGKSGEYTYNVGTSSLGSCWNPHAWQTSGDNYILSYLSTPLVSAEPCDTVAGTYQWAWGMAVSVEDISAERVSDIVRYKSKVKEDEDTYTGYVYEIKLREGVTWESGEVITSEDYIYSMKALLDPEMKNYRANQYYSGECAIAGARAYYKGESEFDTVGLYAVDDYTIRYVLENRVDEDCFLNSLTSGWLVHRELYESLKREDGALTVTSYGTSRETTRSYGAYRLASFEDEKQAVFVRNENWYGYQQDEDGTVYSETEFLVDGKTRRQYQATRVVVDVVSDDVARQRFFRGELAEYSPTAEESKSYSLSDRMYRATDTYTMSLFFNTDREKLSELDRTGVNKNSVVLSNTLFRRALSLSFNRGEFVTVTDGWRPTVGLLSDAYYYDVFNDPESRYRDSDAAKTAMCDLYGIKYGEGERYLDLDAAYRAINGYDALAAHDLFSLALGELTSAGVYTEGEDVKIQIAWSRGALSGDDRAQVQKLSEFINFAAAGTGFGKIVLEPIGNVENRYRDVPSGKYAIGFGAWGGAAFYPFRNFRVYMDPEYASLHEGGCWDPEKEMLTLFVFGEEVTMSFRDWSRSMIGDGRFADCTEEEKLVVTALLEGEFLSLYYRIPLATTVSGTLLSYRAEYLTERYSVMYGYGGFRYLSFNYDDREWAEYLSTHSLDYT